MKRRLAAALAALGLTLVFAGPAMAAPSLGVEIARTPTTINRGDEFVSYEVKVKNSGDAKTSGALNVFIGLPVGLKLAAISGSGWSCSLQMRICANSSEVVAGAFYSTLKLSPVQIDETAPATVTVSAAAAGGGAAAGAVAEDIFSFGPALPFGLRVTDAKAENEAGGDETQAGGHPFAAAATFRLNTRSGPAKGAILPVDFVHSGVGEIPAGVVGNPQTATACPVADLMLDLCPDSAAVGGVLLDVAPNVGLPNELPYIVYRLSRETGYPATFAFRTQLVTYVVRTKVRSDGDYGITALIPLVPHGPAFHGSVFTFCGYGVNVGHAAESVFESCKKRADVGSRAEAFVTNGTNCAAGEPLTRFGVDSWENRGALGANGLPDLTDPNWKVLDFHSPVLTGCEQLTEEWTGVHEPSFTMQPDSHAADSPAAYTAHLHIPQDGLRDRDGLATSHLKDTTVTLPPGLTFNPAIGDGLAACSEEQIGLLGTNFPAPSRVRFDTEMPDCPPNSKVGTASVFSPLLEDTLDGSVYLAAQEQNPFGSDYAIYLSIEEPEIGIVAKLPGEVIPDPATGQITAVFRDNPQLPFEDLELKFFGGARSALANPVTCGSHTVNTAFTPWAAADPENPTAAEIARPSDEISIDSGPGSSPCVSDPAQRPFAVGLAAGTKDPLAGAKSPFSIRVTRPDGSQEFDRLEISQPPGFVASLKGIPYCSEAQIEAAKAASGKGEQQGSSCPAASQIGTTNAGAGAGPSPFYAPGKLYLAGPYKSQTLSVVAVTPAVAGPFDLGNVVIRSALRIDPRTARITAITDRIPQVFGGIPLRIRDVRINLDRSNWAQNPTSCEPLSVDVTAFGASGAVARPSNRFQVGGCENLGFKPKLSIHLKGGTKRGDNPALEARLTTRPGDANIARAAVTLPHSAFLDQDHIRTVCTRVQFAAAQCPKGAVYGEATATTPLLDDPIAGDVLLRSSDNKLPDLVANLRGVANIEAVSRIDSVNGGIRNTFDIIPDAPFEVFTLRMQGGAKGLVVNSRDLCASVSRATVKLVAQNGKRHSFRPKVVADGCKKSKKSKAKARKLR